MDPTEYQNWAVLEVATCYLHGKYGVEIRIMSLNKDNSHSWVTQICEQEKPEIQLEEYLCV